MYSHPQLFTKEGTLAKTASDEPSASADKVSKRQKKQARREAKLMIEIEAAKKDLKKSQKKQSKALARLEEQNTTLHILEARLEELRAQSQQAATDETSQSTPDAEPPSLAEEEATPPEGTVAIQDETEEEAMQQSEMALEPPPAPTPPKKASAPRPVAAHTSTATTRPAPRSQRTRKPPSDAEHEG
jgi:hypothetical protein